MNTMIAKPVPARRGAARSLVAAVVAAALLASTAGVADAGGTNGTRASASRSAAADTGPVVMVTGNVNNAWWVANALSVNSGQRLTETVYYERVLMEMYRQNPSLPPLAAMKEIQALQAAVGQQEKFSPTGSALGDQLVPGFLNVLQKVLDKSPVGKVATEAAKVAFQGLTGAAGDSSGVDQVAQAQDMANHALEVYGQASTILSEVVHMAKDGDHPYFRTAQDMIFASTTAPVGSTAAQMIDANPQLQMLQGINSLIDSNGKIQTNLTQLRQLVTTTMSQVLEQQQKAQDTLDEINAKQDVLLDYAQHQEQRQAEADAAAAKAAEEQNMLSALNSGVSILSTLIGLVDPQFGKAVQVVGSAAIQIGTAISKFSELAAGVGFGGAITSMAGAALTGNIIGAALSLLPLFFDSGPSPDQLILDQIGKLRDQVQELGQHLDSRFDHVDQEIKVVYDQVMDQFQRIDVALGRIQGDVSDMKMRLASLQNQLMHFEGGIYGSLSDGFRRDFWREVDSALGYSRRTGHVLPQADYTHADSVFYTWATHDAYDQAATGPTNRDYSEPNVAAELAKYPLAVNINYLAQLPAIWGLPALSSSALPNPDDWYLGARAYISLQLDDPSAAARNRVLRSEIADISAGGQRLQALERAVTAGPLSGDVPLNPLFDKLWSRYHDYVTAFENDIKQVRDQFASDNHSLDPFAGLGQVLALPNAVTGSSCGVSGSLPGSAVDRLVGPAQRILQSYQQSGAASICVNGGYENVREGVRGKTEWVRGDLVATISARWTPGGGQPTTVRQMQIGLGSEECSTLMVGPEPDPCSLPDPDGAVQGKWSGLQDAATTADVTDTDPATLENLRSQANQYLADLQAQYRAKLADTISSGQTAVDAAGMTSLAAALRAYAELGMPGAVASDELLSSLLLGDQAILDEDQQQRLTRGVLNSDDVNAGRDPWPGLKKTIDERADALRQALSTDLPVVRQQQDGSVATATALWRLGSLADTVTSRSARFTSGRAVQAVPATRLGRTRTLTLKVANAGMGPMRVSGVAVTGRGFTSAGTTCRRVPGGGTCTVSVRFTPTRLGVARGTVTVHANTPTGGASIRLRSTGLRR